MSDVLDFDRLLTPIEGDNPAGANLREDYSPTSVYQTVKMARNAARAAERRQVEGDSDASPDWSPILETVPDAIASQSKDLELAAWLTEALLRKHGFQGLKEGLRLARLLVEQFWDGLYPLPDEDGISTRVSSLGGLNGFDGADGTLIRPINNVPLTEENMDDGPFAQWHYRQAANLEAITDSEQKQSRLDAGAVSMGMIERAEAATSADFCQGTFEQLNACLEEFDGLCAQLEEKCGPSDAPPSSTLRNALNACGEIAKGMVDVKVGTTGEEGDDGEEGTSAEGDAARGGVPGKIKTREDAFKVLNQVAMYFKQTEPHSPLSYALERLVRWGKMPLPELLDELIADESSRGSVYRLVGIPPREE